MNAILIRSLRKGDFFTLRDYGNSEVDSSVVWVFDGFNRSIGKYVAHKFDDICHESAFKRSRLVYTSFIF